MEQNREPRNKPTHPRSINLCKGGKNIQWRKDGLFNKRCWESWTATRISTEITTLPNTIQKINSKWFKDLNVRHDSIELLEENMGEIHFNINCSNIFLHQSLKAKEITAKINKWDLIKLKSFCRATETIERNQDGRVEGRALTLSCENTRITTSCWTIINRKTLKLTKKDTPHLKTKENHCEMVGGEQSQ